MFTFIDLKLFEFYDSFILRKYYGVIMKLVKSSLEILDVELSKAISCSVSKYMSFSKSISSGYFKSYMNF